MAPELARIHHLRGNIFFPLGNIEGCKVEHEHGLAIARRLGSAEAEARALGGLAVAGLCPRAACARRSKTSAPA